MTGRSGIFILPSADARENPVSPEPAARNAASGTHPSGSFGDGEEAPTSRESAPLTPPPWSLEADSLTFRKGFLKILNPGRSPRPGPPEDAGVRSPAETSAVEGEGPTELKRPATKRASVLTETRSHPLRARLTIPPLEEPDEPDELSSFETLARVADSDEADDATGTRAPSGSRSSEAETIAVVDAESVSYTRADGVTVYGKQAADSAAHSGSEGPGRDEAGEVETPRRRRRRGKRAKHAKDIFRRVTEADTARNSRSDPTLTVGAEAAQRPEPAATAASDVGERLEDPGPARPFDVGPRLPVPIPLPRRPAVPSLSAVRFLDRVRSRAVMVGSAVRRSLEAVFGAEVVRVFRKPLEVSVGTLVVAAAVGVVVVALGVLATGRDGGTDTTSSNGRTMPLSLLNLPEIVAGQNLRLLELRNVVLGPGGSAAQKRGSGERPDSEAGRYYIQVQAFQDVDHTHFRLFIEYLNKMGYDNIYKFPMGRISERGRPFYYLRLGPYRTLTKAHAQCEAFKRAARAKPFGRGMDLNEAFPKLLGEKTLESGSRVRN